MVIVPISILFAVAIFMATGHALEKNLDRLAAHKIKIKIDLIKQNINLYSVLLSLVFMSIGLIAGTPLIAISLAVIGGAYPYVAKRAEGARRQREVVYELPYVIDLLTLLVEAGLDLAAAIERMLQKNKRTYLHDELKKMIDEIKLGVSRVDALINFKNRIKNKNVDVFVAMLIQAQRLGSPIKEILKMYGEKMRSERFLMAEQAGVAATQKILFPLVFCIMPAVFVIIFGPVIVMWRQGVTFI